ncbi:uncharacterized protein PAC_19845 [Phialocephala subalpina]|uniref:Uncharacterized protein n=1 Tax=Phialocephala subalpina TaxID=576137 RepID=A0A1L7XY67_9HELO|nr:uncharacterized protein PAC_19845 [Phialocephala subalpina]
MDTLTKQTNEIKEEHASVLHGFRENIEALKNENASFIGQRSPIDQLTIASAATRANTLSIASTDIPHSNLDKAHRSKHDTVLFAVKNIQHERAVEKLLLQNQVLEIQLQNAKLVASMNELQEKAESRHATSLLLQTADTHKDLKKVLAKVQLEMIRVNQHLGHPSQKFSACKALNAQLANLSAAMRRVDTIEQGPPWETSYGKKIIEELKKDLTTSRGELNEAKTDLKDMRT